MFEKFLKRSSWIDLVISAIFVLLGILLIIKPAETVGAIAIILGILFIAMGVLKLVEYYTSKDKDDYLLPIALISVIVGIIILFASNSMLDIFRVILGVWILATGIMDLQTVLAWKEVKSPYWTTALTFTLLIIIAGLCILIIKDIVTVTVGIIILVYAVLDILDRLIFMKKMDNFEKTVKVEKTKKAK